MRVLIIALLAAISYAQTDISMLIPCENRSVEQCKGASFDGGMCMMNYNKMPPRCDSGDMTDREEICASLVEGPCKEKPQCCWTMREFRGKCVPFDLDPEDCPGVMPRIFPSVPTADTGVAADGGADVTLDAGAAADAGADAAVDAGADAAAGADAGAAADAGADAAAGAATGADQAPAQSSPFNLPMMQPNPPLKDRKIALMGCEALTMQGKDVCNQHRSGEDFLEPHICGWSVKEFECQEIELGSGNLCKTVADKDVCNQQADCCWDMKGYCGELDMGDCFRGAPGAAFQPMNPMNLPTINIGGMSIVPGMEEAMERQGEQREASAEFAADQQEAKVEAMGGMGEMMEVDYEELLPVQSCDNLPLCHGRVGANPCVFNMQGQCVQMTMPAMPMMGGVPPLRKAHESSSSSPLNYGHLLMVLGGGLIVGLAAGVCFQGFRSKNSIAPVLLENNYRNI